MSVEHLVSFLTKYIADGLESGKEYTLDCFKALRPLCCNFVNSLLNCFVSTGTKRIFLLEFYIILIHLLKGNLVFLCFSINRSLYTFCFITLEAYMY